jgi:hypothetical protein
VVDGVESSVVGGGDGVADDVQKRTVNSGMALWWSIASSRGGERRPEIEAGSGGVGKLILLWF